MVVIGRYIGKLIMGAVDKSFDEGLVLPTALNR